MFDQSVSHQAASHSCPVHHTGITAHPPLKSDLRSGASFDGRLTQRQTLCSNQKQKSWRAVKSFLSPPRHTSSEQFPFSRRLGNAWYAVRAVLLTFPLLSARCFHQREPSEVQHEKSSAAQPDASPTLVRSAARSMEPIIRPAPTVRGRRHSARTVTTFSGF